MVVTMQRLVGERENIEDVTDIIGHFGRWQKIIFLFMFFIGFPAAWNNLVLTFMAPDIDHWCARPPNYRNMSVENWKNWTIPVIETKNGKPVYSECERFSWVKNDSEVYVDRNHTTECKSWEYNHSFYRSTILEKWNLVCDKSWLVSLSQSIFMSGILIASIVLGHISDRFGRRPVLLTSLAVTFCSGIVCAFSPTYIVFTVMRFFIGCGKSGLFDTCFVHLMESVGAEYRSVIGIAIEFGWAVGYIMLPGIVWVARDWFVIQLSITLPIIFLVSMWWLLPESPRWLLTHGKVKQAEKVIEKAVKTNSLYVCDVGDSVRKLAAKTQQQSSVEFKHRSTILDLIKSSKIRGKAIILSLNWFVVSFVFYGISLHTDSLGGNPFLNFFISGIVEFPAYVACIFIVKYLGRRLPLTLTMIGAGLGCLLTIPVPDSLLWLRITFAMVGKLCVTASYAIIYIYTTEVYPTVVRNIGLSLGSFCAGVGSVIAPFVKELEEYTYPSVPMALFGGLSVIVGLFILRLPETNNKNLEDNIDENNSEAQ